MMRDLSGKRLLLLGSNVWRDIIRKFADDNGVKLIFTGLQPAPLDEVVDEFYRVDSTDSRAMTSFIKEHDIDGIYMGGSETVISSACQYINKLEYPCYCTKEQWEYLQNKSNFKNLCIKFDLPVVPCFTINPSAIENSVPKEAYPVITKPTDGSGSNGFSVCHNSQELIKGYKVANECSPTGSVICEKFVKNKGLVVFYSFTNGRMIYALSEDKYPVKYDKQGSYVAGLFLCESCYKDEFRAKYEDKIRKMFESINIKEGTIWIEIFHDGDNYYFNEVGFRYGGSFSFYSVNYFNEINQVYADMYYALTGDSQLFGFKSLISATVKKGKHYCIYPVHMESGIIAEFEGIEKIRTWSNVVIAPLTKNVGDFIADSGSFAQVVALIHFTFDSLDECKNVIDKVHEVFRVLDKNGNNLIVRKLDWNSEMIKY